MFKRTFQCPSCKENIKIDLSDYVNDSYYERSMGAEIEHTIEDCYNTCSNCNYEFQIEGSIWEYPVHYENCIDLKIK